MTSVLSRPSWTSTSWYGARSSWEYCLAAPTRVGDPGGRVLDLVHQQLGLERVGEPAQAAVEVLRRRTVSRDLSSQSTSTPAATRVGAISQPPAMPWSSSQSPSSSSASLASIGESLGALATRSTASSCSSTSCEQLAAVEPPVGQLRELVPHPGDPLAQRGGGPDRSRRRVVQLVGQPRGQRAEARAAARAGRRSPGCCACRGRAPRAGASAIGNQLRTIVAELVRGQHEEPGVGDGLHRVACTSAASAVAR